MWQAVKAPFLFIRDTWILLRAIVNDEDTLEPEE